MAAGGATAPEMMVPVLGEVFEAEAEARGHRGIAWWAPERPARCGGKDALGEGAAAGPRSP